MEANMGKADKAIRIAVALIIGVLVYLEIITGLLAVILSVAAIVFVLTSLLNFCPLYALLGIRTCKRKNA